ncbi:MAG TPA: hypothetical protein VKV15_11895 [Bryobacteraceae bacterium]|nr:hypothetical protein [Bryobacteraceae bacterium]
MTRRVGGNTQVGIVYTFSKAIGYVDADGQALTWNWTPMLSRNKALAGFDRTHNFRVYSYITYHSAMDSAGLPTPLP